MSALLLEGPVEQHYVNGDDAPLFEIVDGKIVELPEMSMYANKVAKRLFAKISAYLDGHDIGEVDYEILYDLHLPKHRNRRPDLSFVSYQRWPKGRPFPFTGNTQDVVPDLAVEVISPGDLSSELMEKIDEYFRAGVRVVWVIYPNLRIVQIYTSLIAIQSIAESDILHGGDLLPGFSVHVADLFPPVIRSAPTPSDE